MPYTVYVLKSLRTGTRYVGMTSDIEMRLKKHNKGDVLSTKGRRPWQLIHQEYFDEKSAAAKREQFLKSGQGRKQLDVMFNGGE